MAWVSVMDASAGILSGVRMRDEDGDAESGDGDSRAGLGGVLESLVEEGRGVAPGGGREGFQDLLEALTPDEPEEDASGNDTELDADSGDRFDRTGFGGDPLERVRRLIPEGLPPPPRESTESSRIGLVVVGLLVVSVIAGGVFGLPAWTTSLGDGAATPVTGGASVDRLLLSVSDVSYLNRIYAESDVEVAFCGRIHDDSDPPVFSIWLADTVTASENHVEFETANCPDTYDDGILHSHPSGNPSPSPRDLEFLATTQVSVMCIQTGELTSSTGTRVSNLACYEQTNESMSREHVTRIPVEITNTGPDTP